MVTTHFLKIGLIPFVSEGKKEGLFMGSCGLETLWKYAIFCFNFRLFFQGLSKTKILGKTVFCGFLRAIFSYILCNFWSFSIFWLIFFRILTFLFQFNQFWSSLFPFLDHFWPFPDLETFVKHFCKTWAECEACCKILP